MSNSLQPRGLQHTRFSCFSLSPKVCPCPYPLSQWFYSTISSFATLFSFGLQSFLTSGSFPMSWLFTSGDQNIEASITASVFPINIQSQFPLGLTGLISLLSKGLLGVFSSISSLVLSLLHGPNLWSIYVYWKDNTFGCMELCQQSDVFAFKYTVYVCHSFPAKKEASSNFMAAVERLLLSCERCWYSWPLGEKNPIWGQWWGLITHRCCVI